MATTIAVKPETKTMFDEMQKRLGKDFTQDGAIIALIEGYAGDDLLPLADEYEIASFGEVCRHLIGVKAVMRSILSHRQELSDEALAEQAKRAEELAATVAERDEVITDRDKTIAEQAAELEDLRKKAESVDALTKAMHEAEEAQAKRFDDMMSMLKAQVERYESDLADAKSAVDHLTAERDAAQAKIAEVEQERGVLAEQVRELQKRLADVDQAEQE